MYQSSSNLLFISRHLDGSLGSGSFAPPSKFVRAQNTKNAIVLSVRDVLRSKLILDHYQHFTWTSRAVGGGDVISAEHG